MAQGQDAPSPAAAAPMIEVDWDASVGVDDANWFYNSQEMTLQEALEFTAGLHAGVEVAPVVITPAEVPMLASDRRISTIADVVMQSGEFEHAVTAVRHLVWRNGGFVEHSSMNTHRDGLGGSRNRGIFEATLRVPAQGYDVFISGLRNIGHIVSLTETSEDHTAAHSDANIRLETRRVEQDRILVLLARAQDIGDLDEILALEQYLRNVRLEIEGLTRQIDHIDRLAAFNTIHMTLHEVIDDPFATATIDSTGTRVMDAFGSSAGLTLGAARAVAVVLASLSAPFIILLGALIATMLIMRGFRKLRAGSGRL